MAQRPEVLIDFERMKYPNCGLGQYSLNLAKEISRQLDPRWNVTYLVPADDMGRFGATPNYFPVRSYLKKMRWFLPNVQLWHATHQDTEYGPRSTQTPMLLTVHDLNFLKEKDRTKAQIRLKWLQKKVNQAVALTTVSAFTAEQVRTHLQTDNKPIHVIHNGVDLSHLEQPPDLIRPSWAPATTFFLALGVVTRKKNFHVLVEMMKHFPDSDLVIAGYHDGNYVAEIRGLARQFGVEHQVHLPGEVSGAIKAWLYSNCSMFLFPSLLEGFGIPVIEAMSYGKPVVCADQTSLPEVAGPLASYWHDFQPEDMAKVVQHAWEDYQRDSVNKRKSLIQYAQSFSWERAAQRYISVYKGILGI